jgi:hypothetical protein
MRTGLRQESPRKLSPQLRQFALDIGSDPDDYAEGLARMNAEKKAGLHGGG